MTGHLDALSGWCRACGRRIVYGLTEAANKQPLDVEPNPAGNVVGYLDAAATLRVRTLKLGEQPYGYERRFMPHAATCAAAVPRPSELPSNVIDLAQVRARRRRQP
jgi:hypothetical protein